MGKNNVYKVIGVRPCGEITTEMLASKEWAEHWYNENVSMAKNLGGKPKQENTEQGIKAM